jgi:hypothetical protein
MPDTKGWVLDTGYCMPDAYSPAGGVPTETRGLHVNQGLVVEMN